ncbi:MAG: hypothetical protein MI924_03365 [Chloroflexales bacterium]|nr:hypothetical protein [Chloroflexales bacterium]
MAPLSFHIRHEVTPDRCSEVFAAIAEGHPYQHVLQSARQETRLRQLGLITAQELSAEGQALVRLCRQKPALWGDLLHYLHYTRWTSCDPTVHGFSWLYRQFTNLLWQSTQTLVNDTFLKPTVGALIGIVEAEPAFTNAIGKQTRAGAVSLSTSSLVGTLNWLAALQPPMLTEHSFVRRFFCAPELTYWPSAGSLRSVEARLALICCFHLSGERRFVCSACSILQRWIG